MNAFLHSTRRLPVSLALLALSLCLSNPGLYAQQPGHEGYGHDDNGETQGRNADPLLRLRLMRGGNTPAPQQQAPAPEQTAPANQPVAPKMGIIAFTVREKCKVFLNGELQGTISVADEYALDAPVGDHVVEIVSVDNKKRWRSAVAVKEGEKVSLEPKLK